MFEKLVLYSPIIIFVSSYILKFFWFRFSIFIDGLIYGDKIQCFSHMLFWSIVSYIYWVCYQYKISLFQFNNNNLDLMTLFSLVLTIWASYGVYVGFLQFMAGYDNKENGTYLGYQKMDFLTKSNVWYHVTNSWEFLCSLLLSIVLPLLVKFNVSADTSIHYQYIWQAIIGFLLILFIFLLKFSLKVAKITIFINKKTDEGLKAVIKSDIENKYNKYFNRLIKQKFSSGARESYFRQIKIDLSNISNNIDKIIFLKIIYLEPINTKVLDKIEEFKDRDIRNYKCFIKEKYDLISNLEDNELIPFAISLFKLDAQIFDELIKKNTCWIESDSILESPGIFRKKAILGVEYNEKVRELKISSSEYSEINNMHICIFEILAEMAKNKQSISQLVNLIQDGVSKNITRDIYWETDMTNKLLVFEEAISDSSLRISKDNFRRIENIDVFYSSCYPEIEFNSDADSVSFSLHSNIIKIDFYYKDGERYYVKRNEIRDYYDKYEEKVWNILFDKYRDSDNIKNIFLPNLREPKIIGSSFGGRNDTVIWDHDNKIGYSRICFKYLIDNYGYINSSSLNFMNLIEIIKTMSVNYRGAFALYQLLHPENQNWDSSVEIYIGILTETLLSRKEQRGTIYNDMVSIIIDIEHGENLDAKVLGKVFETRDNKLIDDEFLKDFKGIPKLKLIVVQSILSTCEYGFRRVELQERWKKRDLVKQYIRGLSITPRIFPSHTDDCKTLNSSMSEFLLNNMGLLDSYDFGQLPLSSLLLFEDLLHWKWRDDKHNEQEFMINLIKEETEYTLSGYMYSIYGSLLKFFTLKLIEGQGNQYLRIVNDKDFKKDFKFSLLDYLKRNQLTLDTYLDEVTDELKNYDSIMVGIYEKELIKKEVEKIIFENYSYLE